jgi:CRISPR/Cas system-associated exonuclease Cas4 (RecB family)
MALSHSRLSDYNQCPKKFWHKYIDKTPSFKEEGTSPHLVRGTNVHKALENYIVAINNGEEGIPESSLPEVETTKPLIDTLFQDYSSVLPEAQVSINDQWKQVEWFSKDSYYRAIFDMISIRPSDIMITDFKTGKFRDYTPVNGYGQLDMSAAIALSIWPDIPKVTTVYAYVDHRKKVTKEYSQEDKPRLVQWFQKEHEKVNADTKFEPIANEHCKWCPATKLQCRFSRKL